MTEFRMFDAPGADVAEITTSGDVIKPFLNAVGAVVDEAKLRIDERGLSVSAVDPANVFMCEVAVMADEFDTFDLKSETTLGVNIDDLQSAVRRARKASDDELTLSLQERELTATVGRGYDGHDVVSQSTIQLIDPDSIRQEPDMPDLDFDVDVSINAGAFMDALSYSVGVCDHVEASIKGVNQHTNALYLGGETDTRDESVAISNVDSDETADALYSADYLREALHGIGQLSPDTVSVEFSEEYPIRMDAEHSDKEMRVRYFLAPRVRDN